MKYLSTAQESVAWKWITNLLIYNHLWKTKPKVFLLHIPL